MSDRDNARFNRKSSGKAAQGQRPSVEINSFPSIERFLTSGGLF